MTVQKFIKKHAVILSVIAVFFVFFILFDFTCPIKFLVGYPCPTCGVTRAMLSLLRFDFNAYMHYNALALFLATSILLFIHARFIKSKTLRYIIYIYFALVMVANVPYYIYRLLV